VQPDVHAPPPPRKRSPRDLLAALTSGFVGALALASSLYNVYLQRQQLRAAVIPRLTIQGWQDEKSFGMSVANRGVGPADVKRMRVLVDGKPMESWVNAITTLLHVKSITAPQTKDIATMLSAGLEVPIFSYELEDYLVIMKERKRVSVELCYCSTLGDCWLLANPWDGTPDTTAPIAECPADPIPFTSYTREQSDQLIDSSLAALRARRDAGAERDGAK
jgi:hypothetical protein